MYINKIKLSSLFASVVMYYVSKYYWLFMGKPLFQITCVAIGDVCNKNMNSILVLSADGWCHVFHLSNQVCVMYYCGFGNYCLQRWCVLNVKKQKLATPKPRLFLVTPLKRSKNQHIFAEDLNLQNLDNQQWVARLFSSLYTKISRDKSTCMLCYQLLLIA